MISRSPSLCRTTQAPSGLKRSLTLSSSNWSGVPALKRVGGSDSTLGNRKRTVPSVMPTIDAVKVTQPMLAQLPTIDSRKKRRDGGGALAGAAGLGGMAGLGGAAGAGAAAAGATAVSGLLVLGSDMCLPTGENSPQRRG